MRFAVNYSAIAVKTIRDETVNVHYLKCPDWPDTVDEALKVMPVIVHFPFHAGMHDIETVGVEKTKHLLNRTSTLFVNTHLKCSGPPSPIAERDALQAMKEDIEHLCELFQQDNIIAENIYFPPGKDSLPRFVCDPELIHRVIDDTKIGFLLDISHARIAAKQLEIPADTYFSLLPTARLKEIHITGISRNENYICDHHHLSDDDWEFFDWSLQQIIAGSWATPAIITSEIGGVSEWFLSRTDNDIYPIELKRLAAAIDKANSLMGINDLAEPK